MMECSINEVLYWPLIIAAWGLFFYAALTGIGNTARWSKND